MPIIGLTDNVQAAFPSLGRLRKGGEATRNKDGQVVKMGADLTFFRFTSERADVQLAFDEAYGQEPALINAYLPYASPEANFPNWKEEWAAGGLKHRCDGVTCVLWLGPDGKYQRDPKPCPGGCKEVGRLLLVVPELVRAGFVGYVVLETHGNHDLRSIMASLLAAAEARGENPMGLRGIPWVLRRQSEKISTPMGNGKRARRSKWLVKLEPASDWVQLQLQAAHSIAMHMLPAPVRVVDGETGEVMQTAAQPMPAARVADDVPSQPPDFEDGDYEEIPDVGQTLTPDQPPTLDPLAARRADFARYLEGKTPGWIGLFRQRIHDEYKVSLDEANLDTLDLAWARIHEKKAVAP